MKNKLIKIIILSLTLGFITSCEDANKNLYQGDSYISFGSNTSASALESSTTPITITAYASIPNIQNNIDIGFTITSDFAVEGTHYTVLNNKTSFNFGPGNYTDTIQIMPINNFIEDGPKILNVTLNNSNGNYTLGFPGPDANGKTFIATLEDDDCAFTLQQLGNATWSGSDNVPSSQAGPNDSQITTSFDGTNLLLEGIGYGWITDPAYWDEVVVNSYPVITQVDLITGAIIITQQPLCDTTWLGSPQSPYSIVGTGQYVSCTQTMTINYDIIQGGGVLRSFSETLIMN